MVDRGPSLVFVYGTLMPGHLRWPLLAPVARARVPTSAPGTLYDTGRGWPAAVFEEAARPPRLGRSRVPGWAVAVALDELEVVLERLDELEGPTYERVRAVAAGQGWAWTYQARQVEAGWRAIERWPAAGEH